MQFSEVKPGRIFVVRLEDGEILHETIENFAAENHISAAALIAVGGADTDSRLIVGPEESRANTINPMEHILGDAHEIAGTGTIFPGENGQPILHMHLAAGRRDQTITGCVRRGVRVWYIMEIIIWELTDTSAARRMDPNTGFQLLTMRKT